MKYVSTLISVKDMEVSKKFYHDVLGLEVISDLGANVTLTGGFALQRMDTWQYFIANKEVSLHNNAIELVFEEKEFEPSKEFVPQTFNYHTHTALCGHADGEIKEYIEKHKMIDYDEFEYISTSPDTMLQILDKAKESE